LLWVSGGVRPGDKERSGLVFTGRGGHIVIVYIIIDILKKIKWLYMGYKTEVIKWQFKRYWITGLILIVLGYLAWSSYEGIHIFKNRVFLGHVVFEAIVMGFVGSLFFLAFLFSLKPNIKIADKICFNEEKGIYYFKMVNMSLLFPLKDVEVSIFHNEVVEAFGEGNNLITNNVHIKNSNFSHVESILGGLDNKVYAFIVQSDGTIIDDINETPETNDNSKSIVNVLGEQHNHIELNVYARHALSGFSIQKSQIFKNARHLETGEYQTGISVEILEKKQ